MRFYVSDGILPGFTVRLVNSKKKRDEAIRHFAGGLGGIEGLIANATTSIMKNPETNETIYLVWIDDKPGRDEATEHALLAHEAVHVAVNHLRELGIDEPDEETFAYAVQAVTVYLIDERMKWRRKKGKGRK